MLFLNDLLYRIITSKHKAFTNYINSLFNITNNNKHASCCPGSKQTFFGQASSFACPRFAVVAMDFALGAVWLSCRHVARLREGLAGGVAGRGLALAALGFGFEPRLVQRLLLRRPVAVHLHLVVVLVAAVRWRRRHRLALVLIGGHT